MTTLSPEQRATLWAHVGLKHDLPAWFLDALAWGESRFDTDARTGSFVGILQVGPMVLEGYNKANTTNYKESDLTSPTINAEIAAWQIRRIIDEYQATSRRSAIPELSEDWTSADWILLVLAGWNSGWSHKAGVLKVAKFLHDRKLRVTHGRVFDFAKEAGATRHLDPEHVNEDGKKAGARKRRWQRGVSLRAIQASD